MAISVYQITKRLADGVEVPFWYGAVGHDINTKSNLVAIIPLNYLIRFWHFLIRKDAKLLHSDKFRQMLVAEQVKAEGDTRRRMKRLYMMLNKSDMYHFLLRFEAMLEAEFIRKKKHKLKADAEVINEFIDKEWDTRNVNIR